MAPFRVTTVERTLADLPAVVSPRRLEAALDNALFKGLTTLPRLARFVDSVRRPGMRRISVLATMITERDPAQAPAESFFETDFYRFLRRSPLGGEEFQYSVFDHKGFIGRLDVAYPAHKVGLECHSLRWHSARERVKRDAERHNRLTAAGWRVLYETYETLRERPGEIHDRLSALLR